MKPPSETSILTWPKALLWASVAIVSFHLAYFSAAWSFCILIFLSSLFQLHNVSSDRKAFYFGLFIGLAIYAPHLSFFWKIFDRGAIALWLVLAFWIGLFLLLAHHCAKKFGRATAVFLIPFLWTGLEYFRSELYYLRFSWMSVGYAFSFSNDLFLFKFLGVYGIGFVLALIASLATFSQTQRRTIILLGTCSLALALPNFKNSSPPLNSSAKPFVAGVQLEFPDDKNVVRALDALLKKFPETDLFVLSEYTFLETVPAAVKSWCKRNQRHLIVGGKDPAGSDYYDTAFVVGTNGEVVFKQAKSVPIQFFKDGLAAKKQNVWDSPWGKIGICICYDLSYRRVVDELIRQGAQALIVPTMDVIDWGKYQHELHSRIGPARAAEFGIPVVRIASSGISQIVNSDGSIQCSAPFPGENEMIAGRLDMKNSGHRPLDFLLAPLAVLITGATIIWLAAANLLSILRTRKT